MKRLKSLLIVLFCLVATLPIVYTNNVYAYEEVSIATFSLPGRAGYSYPTTGSNSYTNPNILNFSDYSLMSVTVNGFCENLSSASNSLTVTAENYDTGEVQTLTTKTLPKGSFSSVTTNFDIPSGWKRGKITVTYSWSGLKMKYENGSSYGSSRINSGSITGLVIPHTHSYTPSATTEATCTTDGETTWTCSCGDSYTTPIPAPGHTFQTLTINSQKAVERCIKCGFLGSGNLTHVNLI